MSSTAVATVIKMMESLPEPVQDQVVEYLRDYIADLQDEIEWELSFQKRQQQLIATAQRARQEITEGHAEPMDYNQRRKSFSPTLALPMYQPRGKHLVREDNTGVSCHWLS